MKAKYSNMPDVLTTSDVTITSDVVIRRDAIITPAVRVLPVVVPIRTMSATTMDVVFLAPTSLLISSTKSAVLFFQFYSLHSTWHIGLSIIDFVVASVWSIKCESFD